MFFFSIRQVFSLLCSINKIVLSFLDLGRHRTPVSIDITVSCIIIAHAHLTSKVKHYVLNFIIYNQFSFDIASSIKAEKMHLDTISTGCLTAGVC